MFDGRAIQYEFGYEKFLENPYFGIGLNNYKQFDGYNLVLHSEYLVQLIENGLVGFILFFLFYCRYAFCSQQRYLASNI